MQISFMSSMQGAMRASAPPTVQDGVGSSDFAEALAAASTSAHAAGDSDPGEIGTESQADETEPASDLRDATGAVDGLPDGLVPDSDDDGRAGDLSVLLPEANLPGAALVADRGPETLPSDTETEGAMPGGAIPAMAFAMIAAGVAPGALPSHSHGVSAPPGAVTAAGSAMLVAATMADAAPVAVRGAGAAAAPRPAWHGAIIAQDAVTGGLPKAATEPAGRSRGASSDMPMPTPPSLPPAGPGVAVAAQAAFPTPVLRSAMAAAAADALLPGEAAGLTRTDHGIGLPAMLQMPAAARGVAEAHAIPQGTPRALIAQVSAAIARTPDGGADLSLHPRELGLLRLSLSPTETGLVVTLTAERPETLDLLRRHAAELGQDLRSLGFRDVDLNFAGAGSDHFPRKTPDSDGDGPGLRTPVRPDIEPLAARHSGPDAIATGGGLDIRL